MAQTIGEYIIEKLAGHGVKHIFGVPGDYALTFYKNLEESDIEVINTCGEEGAGFAADAYARLNGLGAVCITYCVGGLKTANSTAQAFAEKSPVIVISGAPGIKERNKNPLLHHKVQNYDTQLKVYEEFTVAATSIDNTQSACREIDRVFDAVLKYKRPGYIELPRDMVNEAIIPYSTLSKPESKCIHDALEEALKEATNLINSAKQPVILAGVEMHRFGFQDLLLKFIEKTNIPVAATLLGKTVISELHPLYLGIYEGAMGRKEVIDYIESSDCLLILGAFMSDINLGIYTAHLEQKHSIYVTSETISIGYHSYQDICMDGFLNGLMTQAITCRPDTDLPNPLAPTCPSPAEEPVTVDFLFQYLNSFIDDNSAVIADPGDAMFAAIDMTIHNAAEFFAPAYYASLGFAVPASLGIQCFDSDLRPIVLVGDGAFQMSGTELSTIARFGLSPIIIVLNNNGYGTERPMLDGQFNDVLNWHYHNIPELLGAGQGFFIKSEKELVKALDSAKANTTSFSILNVHLAQDDCSMALKRLTTALSKMVHK